MRYLDVCAGVSAVSLAWRDHLGWTPAGYSEIEAFPRAVLEQRHGAIAVDFDEHRHVEGTNVVPLFGDFTQIQEHHVGPVRLLVGGTPCQSFSLAGKRLGLDDPRGHLALEFLALAGRLRPEWVVWENVPGVLSQNGGRDFGAFLGELGKLGYGWSYRVLDAQFARVGGFGRAVPQRRRRVFVVGRLGDATSTRAVLFEREGLRGCPAPRRGAGEDVAGTLASSSGKRGMQGEHEAQSGHLIAEAWDGRGRDEGTVLEGPYDTAAVRASSGGSSRSYVLQRLRVRRLMPVECERLQGMPDGFTDILVDGRPASDTARYKAIGNSMAVNVMRWIGERIAFVDGIERKAS
jgi:DNA (cytosine-5)-methyltransferase 1